MRPIGAHGVEVMYFGSFCFRGELGFLNCNDICMCVVSKHFVMRVVLFLLDANMLRECKGDDNASVGEEGDVVAVSAGYDMWVLHVIQILCLVHLTRLG